jgi:hypothetical protein
MKNQEVAYRDELKNELASPGGNPTRPRNLRVLVEARERRKICKVKVTPTGATVSKSFRGFDLHQLHIPMEEEIN